MRDNGTLCLQDDNGVGALSGDPMLCEWSQLQELDRRMHQLPFHDVSSQQWQWLKQLLARQQDAAFGRQHCFSMIDSVAAYRRSVPLTDYNGLTTYIARIVKGEGDILFRGQPVVFEKTGGTSGKKLLPYPPESLQSFRQAMLPWLAQLIESHAITNGSLYWLLSPALREPAATEGGIAIGVSDADYFGNEAAVLLASLSAVPSWVGEMTSFRDWQLVTLYYLLRRGDLALISVWSPTFLLALLEAIPVRADELLQELAQGVAVAGVSLAPDVSAQYRLEQYLAKRDTSPLWPDLKVISCWMDAASQPFANKLKKYFPATTFQAKGLIATERVVTVPDDDGRPVVARQGT